MVTLKIPLSNIPGDRDYVMANNAINIPLKTVLDILNIYEEEVYVWEKHGYTHTNVYYFINTNSDGYRALVFANQLAGSTSNLLRYAEIFPRVCITESDCQHVTEPKQGEYVDYYVTVKGIRKYSVPF